MFSEVPGVNGANSSKIAFVALYDSFASPLQNALVPVTFLFAAFVCMATCKSAFQLLDSLTRVYIVP